MERSSYRLWRRLSRRPIGKRIFSLGLSLKAPYFRSVRPRVEILRPGHCEVTIKDRRRVHNHIGGVHAIAMCNLAEAAMGALAEASVTREARWIPIAMKVRYLAPARTDLRATATMDPIQHCAAKTDVDIPVTVRDRTGTEVFDAVITIRVSP
ncbi:MAG: DUF4442 domain-containing protein [Actinobacteria bacterium]|nr:DUF4442 domain-containing protein [Actinomycetota bacterium]